VNQMVNRMMNRESSSFRGNEESNQWYHIKAKHSTIGVISFWLCMKNKHEVKKEVMKKGYTGIEWIREETPPFI